MKSTADYLLTARKRSLGQGNVFTGVFLSMGGGVGGFGFPACITGHMPSIRGGGLHPGGSAYGGGGLGWADPPGTRKAGGTHPTGMLSCF